MNGRIPSNLFPFASDDGGDLICISLWGDDSGNIVFWDYYNEHFPPTYANVYYIASSFSEFINNMFENPIRV